MNNLFKSNSRFASLIDEMPTKEKRDKQKQNEIKKNNDNKDNDNLNEGQPKFNSFKDERPKNNNTIETIALFIIII